MGHLKFFCAGTTQAVRLAAATLGKTGIAFSSVPGTDITDLLLDIPSFDADGNLRDGEDPDALLSRISPGVRIWGGNLPVLYKYQSFDLLTDPVYLAENAMITADCALKIASPLLQTTWRLSHVLIIGWGRIGKQLAKFLKALGADVTVCARSPADRALLLSLGYHPLSPENLCCRDLDVLFNTVPAPVLDENQLSQYKSCIAIDLASIPGLKGRQVIPAKGLPGRLAPRASADLIQRTILRLGKEVF